MVFHVLNSYSHFLGLMLKIFKHCRVSNYPFGHQIRSDQISRSVVSDSLRPHESQHVRPPCPTPTPGVHSDSRPVIASFKETCTTTVFGAVF